MMLHYYCVLSVKNCDVTLCKTEDKPIWFNTREMIAFVISHSAVMLLMLCIVLDILLFITLKI